MAAQQQQQQQQQHTDGDILETHLERSACCPTCTHREYLSRISERNAVEEENTVNVFNTKGYIDSHRKTKPYNRPLIQTFDHQIN